MPQSQRLLSGILFAAIGRPACPKCKAPMMLVSIEPAGAQGVDFRRARGFICIVPGDAAPPVKEHRPFG